jgi:phthiodiolone/phenolphthiodiolone dimycocerosates ketoreductase
MPKTPVETMMPINSDRSLPPAALAAMCRAIKDSGAVDYVHVWDQLIGWWPACLWTTEYTPMAALVKDMDTLGDAPAVCAFAAAAAPGLGLTISPDAIRRGPAEMLQALLTLANMGEGRAILQLGAGELKQCQPFGWKRSEGLKRFEDHLRYYDAFWKTEGPISLEGHFWKYDHAWIGGGRPAKRPRVWALGGGPKLIEMATSYADGFATMVPNVLSTPERFGEFVHNTRNAVAAKGRDPDRFDFCPWVLSLVHEDPNVIDRALDNPILRWMSAFAGRLNMAAWREYSIEPPFSEDWHYSQKLLPHRYTDAAEVKRILSKVTRKMAELSYIYGSPAEVAKKIQPFIDAGATCVDVGDLLPLVLDPQDAQHSLGRSIEVCKHIKQRNH